jgi:uncharacterized protein with NRDE domain
MCIVFVALRSHPRWRVVIAANRDEFVTRETERAARWLHVAQHEDLLAGRDARAGGTWMGVNVVDGRWAALVNIAPPEGAVGHDPSAPSRGGLATEYLLARPAESPLPFAKRLASAQITRR